MTKLKLDQTPIHVKVTRFGFYVINNCFLKLKIHKLYFDMLLLLVQEIFKTTCLLLFSWYISPSWGPCAWAIPRWRSVVSSRPPPLPTRAPGPRTLTQTPTPGLRTAPPTSHSSPGTPARCPPSHCTLTLTVQLYQ